MIGQHHCERRVSLQDFRSRLYQRPTKAENSHVSGVVQTPYPCGDALKGTLG